jgi:hypothetical protein
MKRLFGILNLILCFELIVGPHTPGLQKMFEARADDSTCPAGLVFDSTLNRCITSDQQASIINATSSCNGDQECYKRLAEEELKKGEEEGKIEEAVKDKGGLFNNGMKAAAVAVPLLIGAKALMSSGKCLSIGKIAMVAGGLALFVGDMLANKKHKSCLKKIEDEWEKKKAATTETTSSGVTKVSMSEAQSEAFEMLAKKEECMQSAAKMKAGFYGAGAAAFAATAVMSVMEIMKEKHLQSLAVAACSGPQVATPPGAAACKTASDTSLAYTASITCQPGPTAFNEIQKEANDINLYALYNSPVFENDYKFNSFYQSIPSDGFDFPFRPESDSNHFYKVVNKLIDEFTIQSAHAFAVGSMLTRPEPRAAISGILAAWAVTMMMHASKQARVSKNRAEFLRNLKQDFDDATGAISCTAEERSMSGNANCYCYTESGQRNSERTNSQVCQQLWTGNSLAQAGSYTNPLDFSNQRVCISASGAADETCSCAATKSCLNAIPASGNLGLGSISVASSGMKPLNDLANGQIGAGSINGSAAGSLAAKLLDESNKLKSKAGVDPKKQKALSKQIEDSLIASGAGIPSPIQNSSPLPMNMTPTQAAQALENDLGSGRSFEQVNGSPAIAQPGSAKAVDGGGFTLTNPEAVTTDQQVAEAMKQDLNYGQNDITKSDSNLFQILTNRYQRSGMRRLFDDEGKMAADQANKNDISK